MEQEKKEALFQAETLEARLKEWGIDLETFRTKTDKAKGKAKTELEKEVAALRAKLNEAQKKLEELKKAGEAASGELKKGVENAWTELKKAFDRGEEAKALSKRIEQIMASVDAQLDVLKAKSEGK